MPQKTVTIAKFIRRLKVNIKKEVLDPASVDVSRRTVLVLHGLLQERIKLDPKRSRALLRKVVGCLELLPQTTKIAEEVSRRHLEQLGDPGPGPCPEWPIMCGRPCR